MKQFLLQSTLCLGLFGVVSAQNVGIGTTSFTPNDDALLELRSTTSGFLMPKMTEAQRDAIVGPTDGLMIYQTNATKGFRYYNGTSWVTFGASAADNFGNHVADLNISLDDHWLSNDGGNEGIRISNNGYVGIGASSPTNKLTISGSNSDTSPVLAIQSGNDNSGINNGAQIAFGYNGTATYQHFIQTRHNSGTLQSNSIDFYVSDGTQNNTLTSGSVHALSMNGGNVGIGTTSPSKKLHVISSTSNANVITVQSSASNGWSSIDFLNQSGSLSATFGFANSGTSGIFTGRAYMNSYNNDFVLTRNSTENSIFISGSSGNIGIGTASPAAKLHVAGDARISDLAGSGTRMVVADANGDLSTQDITTAVSGALDEITRAVSASSTQSTSSGTNSDLNSMSMSVEAGRYIFQFNCDMEVTNGNTVGEFSFNVNGSTVSESIRKIKPGTNSPGIATLITVVDVPAAGTVKVQFRRNAGSGTVSVEGRTLMVMKISI